MKYNFSFKRALEIALGFALGTLGGWFLIGFARYAIILSG